MKPTYLYIKQHSITKKLYFGMTTKFHKDMLKYKGSGDYWNDHLKNHGKEHVETLWYSLFTEKEEIVKFALGCSDQWDIVKSKDEFENKIWANEIPENGLNTGSSTGWKHSEQTKIKIGIKSIGNTYNQGRIQSKEEKLKRSISNKGIPCPQRGNKGDKNPMFGKNKPLIECPHCKFQGKQPNIYRFHFKNCKIKREEMF